MKGVYRIPLPEGIEPSAHPPVVRLLKQLDAGAQYDINVRENLNFSVLDWRWGGPHLQSVTAPRYVEIRAHGGKAKRKPCTKLGISIPAAPTVAQITKRLADAQRNTGFSTLRSKLHDQWFDVERNMFWRLSGSRNHEKRLKQKRIGKLIALIIARHRKETAFYPTAEDYATLDKALQMRVPRFSELRKHDRLSRGYIGWLIWTYADGQLKTRHEKWQESHPEKEHGHSLTPIMQVLENRVDLQYLRELKRLAEEKNGKSTSDDASKTPEAAQG